MSTNDSHSAREAMVALADLALHLVCRLDTTSGRKGGGITVQEYCTLNALLAGPSHPAEIQSLLGLSAPQMTRILRRLEDAGNPPLIRCSINRADRRRKDVTLTPEGRRLVERYLREVFARSSLTLRDFGEADLKRLCKILHCMKRGLLAQAPEC